MDTRADHNAEAKQHLAFAETNSTDGTAVLHALLAAQVHATLALRDSVDDLTGEVRGCLLVPMDHLKNSADNLIHNFERIERGLDNVASAVGQ